MGQIQPIETIRPVFAVLLYSPQTVFRYKKVYGKWLYSFIYFSWIMNFKNH